MKTSTWSLTWAAAACSLLLLSGCDKLKAVDDLAVKSVVTEMHIESLKKSVAEARKENDVLRSQVIALYDRVAAVEKLQVTQPTKEPSGPAAPPKLTAEGAANLKAVIDACVQVGRSVPPPKYGDNSMAAGFDAYYNPANGLVQNNVRFAGEMPALYAFNKCMTSKGVPPR